MRHEHHYSECRIRGIEINDRLTVNNILSSFIYSFFLEPPLGKRMDTGFEKNFVQFVFCILTEKSAQSQYWRGLQTV